MKFIRLAIILFLIFLFWRCGEEYVSPLEVVPSNATILISLETSQIPPNSKIGDAVDIQELYKELSAMKLEPENLSELVVFADEKVYYDNEEFSGIVIQGRFNAEKKIKSLVDKDCSKQEYHGCEYYLNSASDECVMVIDSNSLAFGYKAAIKSIIDVKEGELDNIFKNPQYKRILSHFSLTDAPMQGYFMLPKAAYDMGKVGIEGLSGLSELLGVGAIGAILQKIGMVKGFGISLDEKADKMPVELLCIMGSESAASLISGSLNLMRGLTGIMPQDNMTAKDKEAIDSFNNMIVSRDKDLFTIRMDLEEL